LTDQINDLATENKKLKKRLSDIQEELDDIQGEIKFAGKGSGLPIAIKNKTTRQPTLSDGLDP